MAPADRPNAAYQMFDKFIRGSSEENVDIVVE